MLCLNFPKSSRRPGKKEFKIGGENINNIRFTDDTLLLTESAEDIKLFVEIVEGTCVKCSVSIVKTMFISKDKPVNLNIVLFTGQVENVDRIKYLGAWINSNGDLDEELKVRIE